MKLLCLFRKYPLNFQNQIKFLKILWESPFKLAPLSLFCCCHHAFYAPLQYICTAASSSWTFGPKVPHVLVPGSAVHFSVAGIRTVRLNERSIQITHYQLAASLLDPITKRVPPAEVGGLYNNYGAIFVFFLGCCTFVQLYYSRSRSWRAAGTVRRAHTPSSAQTRRMGQCCSSNSDTMWVLFFTVRKNLCSVGKVAPLTVD